MRLELRAIDILLKEWKNEREMKKESFPDCSTQKMKYIVWRFIKIN